MRFFTASIVVAAALALGQRALADNFVVFTGPVTDVDGRLGPQWTGAGTQDVQVRRRPWVASDHGGTLNLQNYYIHHVTNQKNIDIGLESIDRVPGQTLQWAQINISHVLIEQGLRNAAGIAAGLHLDGIRIASTTYNMANLPLKTNVTLNDVVIRNNDGVVPIMIQEGNYGTVTFRDVHLENNIGRSGSSTFLYTAQMSTHTIGRFDRIIIEDSPGFQLSIFGRTGSFGEIIIRNSPGAAVFDLPVPFGSFAGQVSGVKVVYESSAAPGSAVQAVPEPAAASLLILAAGLLRRRR